jgi:EcoRII C terminal
MSRQKTEVGRKLVAKFKRKVPSNEQIVRDTLRDVLDSYEGDIDTIKASVSRIIVDAERRAHERYLEAQKSAQESAILEIFSELTVSATGPRDVLEVVAGNATALDEFFLSIAQGRKSRAGGALETFFDTVFRSLGYPFEREHVVNGTPDFVFPSVLHFQEHATDCIIFTSKRTLRERWRQITSEGSRGFLLYLGTVDSQIKPADLQAMKEQKINLVIPESIRAAAYPQQRHVISVEDFLQDVLDPAMDRWRRKHVIT